MYQKPISSFIKKVLALVLFWPCHRSLAQTGEVFLNQGTLRGNPIFLEQQRLLVQVNDRVSFWDVDRNMLLKQYAAGNQFLSGISRSKYILSVSPNGNYLLTGDTDSLYLYHTPTQTQTAIAHPFQLDIASKLKAWFSTDEKTWVVYYETPFVNRLLRAFQTRTNTELDTRALNRSIARENSMQAAMQGNTLMMSNSDGHFRRLILQETPVLDSFWIRSPDRSLTYWHNFYYWANANRILLLGENRQGKSILVSWNLQSATIEKITSLSFRASPSWFTDDDRITVRADRYHPAAMESGYLYASLNLSDTTLWEGSLPNPSNELLGCMSRAVYRNGHLLIPCEESGKSYVVNLKKRKVSELPIEVKPNWMTILGDRILYRSNGDLTNKRYSLLQTDNGALKKIQLPYEFLHLSPDSKSSEPFIIRRYADARYDLSRLDSNLQSFPYKRLQMRPDSLSIYLAGRYRDVFYFGLKAADPIVDDNMEFDRYVSGMDWMNNTSPIKLSYLEHQGNTGRSRFFTETYTPGVNTLFERLKDAPAFFSARYQLSEYGFQTIDSLILMDSRVGEPMAIATAQQIDSMFSYSGASIAPMAKRFSMNKRREKIAFIVSNTLYLLSMKDQRFTRWQNTHLDKSIGNGYSILVTGAGFCNQDKHLYVIHQSGDSLFLNLLDTASLRSVYRFGTKNNRTIIQPGSFAPFFLVNDRQKKIIGLYNYRSNKPMASYPAKNNTWLFNELNGFFNADGDRFILAEQTGELIAHESNTGKPIQRVLLPDNNFKPIGFSGADAFHFLTASGQPHEWNIRSNQILPYNLSGASLLGINDAHLLPTDSLLITTTSSSIQWWSLNNRRLIKSALLADTSGVFLRADSGYYTINKSIFNEVLFRDPKGKFVTPIQQFDVWYNRPSYFIHSTDSSLASYKIALEKAYQKRIKKTSSTSKQRVTSLICDVTNKRTLSTFLPSDTAELHIGFSGSNGKPIQLHILVNGVPIYGQRGRSLAPKTLDTTIRIRLTEKENDLMVYGTDTEGNSSNYFPLLAVAPAEKNNGRLHFIGIGIEQFADQEYNLKFSSKDIRDLAYKLKERFGSAVKIDTLFNEEVTAENIRKLKEKLLTSAEEDKVIISYSGHGLLSKEYDYYLSTYGVNFSEPEKGGLPYADLEELLDNIPARRKLLLIDACHSGEIDKEEVLPMQQSADSLGLTRGFVKEEAQNTPKLGLFNSFELMRELFVNLGSGTGSMVISAAAGNQYALERGDLRNGVFTYTILEALDKFKTLQAAELRRYVSERVSELTRGLQQPTVRNETRARDWSVW